VTSNTVGFSYWRIANCPNKPKYMSNMQNNVVSRMMSNALFFLTEAIVIKNGEVQ